MKPVSEKWFMRVACMNCEYVQDIEGVDLRITQAIQRRRGEAYFWTANCYGCKQPIGIDESVIPHPVRERIVAQLKAKEKSEVPPSS